MSTWRTLLVASSLIVLSRASTAAQAATATLRGTVTDSIRHGPLPGATIVASMSVTGGAEDAHDYTAMTNERGEFSMTSLLPGTYRVSVEHPWLDSTGFSVPSKSVQLKPRRTATVKLAVPSGPTIRTVLCSIVGADSASGLVAGYVKEAGSGHPVGGARVVFAWNDFEVDRRTAQATPHARMTHVSTRSDGTFRACGLPVSQSMLMQAQFGEHDASGAIEVQLPESGVLVETLLLDTTGVGMATVHGVVTRQPAGHPIAGAHVQLYGAANDVVTSSNGSFVLNGVPFGTQSIEVTALGFAPRRYAIDINAAGSSVITIALSSVGTILDSVQIRGIQTDAPTRNREFDERSAHGSGQYITEEMIAKAHPVETVELLQQVRGYYVMSDTVYSSRGITRVETDADHVCKPAIYIDGNLTERTMNDVAPSAIHGIEIYASAAGVPPKYRAASCGAIFVWMK